MATYLQGVTDYIPEYQPFQPDFNFFASALQTKQNRYDKNWSQLNKVYGKFVNAPLTHRQSISNRDQYLKGAVKNIQKISGLDLSLEQNVQQAMQVFTPFYNDKNLLYDMHFTEQANSSRSLGQSYQNCTGKDCEGLYWLQGIQAIDYKVKEFGESNYDEIFNIAAPKYVPFAQGFKEAGQLVKDLGIDIETTSFQNGNIVTYRNGEVAKIPIYQALLSGLGNDPRYKDMYKTQAYVDRMGFVEQQVAAGVSKEEAQQTFANNTVAMYSAMITDEAEKAKTQQSSLDAMAIRAKNIIDSIGMELDEGDPLVQTANTIAREQQMAQQIYTDADAFVKSLEVVQGGDGANTNPSGIQSSATPSSNAKLSIAEAIRAQALMINDFTAYANDLSTRNAKIKQQRDPLAIQQSANEASRRRMLEKLYLEGKISFDSNGNPFPLTNGTVGGSSNGFEPATPPEGSAGQSSEITKDTEAKLTEEQRAELELKKEAAEGDVQAFQEIQASKLKDQDATAANKSISFFRTLLEKAKEGDAYARNQLLGLIDTYRNTNSTTKKIVESFLQDWRIDWGPDRNAERTNFIFDVFFNDHGSGLNDEKLNFLNSASQILASAIKTGNKNLINYLQNGMLNPNLRGNEVVPEWVNTAYNSSNLGQTLRDAADNAAYNNLIIEQQNAVGAVALDNYKNSATSANDKASLYIIKNVIGDYKKTGNPMPYRSEEELANAIYSSLLPKIKFSWDKGTKVSIDGSVASGYKRRIETPIGDIKYFDTDELKVRSSKMLSRDISTLRQFAKEQAEAFYGQYVKSYSQAQKIANNENTAEGLMGQGSYTFGPSGKATKLNIDPAKGGTLQSNTVFYNMISPAFMGNVASAYNYSFSGNETLNKVTSPKTWAPKLLDVLARDLNNSKSKSTFSVTPLPIVNGTPELKGYQVASVSESTLTKFADSQGIDTKSEDWKLFKTQMMSEKGLTAYGNPNQLSFQPINYLYEAPKSLALFNKKQQYILMGDDLRQKVTITYDPATKMVSSVFKGQVFNENTRRYESFEQLYGKLPITELTNSESTSTKDIDVVKWKSYIGRFEEVMKKFVAANNANVVSPKTTDDL
jgi:ASC-1-like (ASCH) protein